MQLRWKLSFHINRSDIGAGWIIRNSNGFHCLSGSSRLKQASTLLQAEGIALLHANDAMQSAWCRGYKSIVMEGDCHVLHDLISHKTTNITMYNLIVDISSWVNRFEDITFIAPLLATATT